MEDSPDDFTVQTLVGALAGPAVPGTLVDFDEQEGAARPAAERRRVLVRNETQSRCGGPNPFPSGLVDEVGVVVDPADRGSADPGGQGHVLSGDAFGHGLRVDEHVSIVKG